MSIMPKTQHATLYNTQERS